MAGPFDDLIPSSSKPKASINPFQDLIPGPAPGVADIASASVKRKAGQAGIAAGNILDDAGIKTGIGDAGRDVVANNMPAVSSLEDIAESPIDAAVQAASETPVDIGINLAGRAAGAGIGGFIGRRIGMGAQGTKLGEEVGGWLTSSAQSYGGIREEQKAEGIDSIPRALLAAGASGLVETAVGPERLISKYVKGGGKLAPGASRATNAAVEGGKAALGEGATEYVQSQIEQVGAGQDPFTAEGQKQAGFEAVMGAGGGGVIGGVVGAAAPREAVRPPQNTEEMMAQLATGQIPNAKIDSLIPAAPGAAQNETATAGPMERVVNQNQEILDAAGQAVEAQRAAAAAVAPESGGVAPGEQDAATAGPVADGPGAGGIPEAQAQQPSVGANLSAQPAQPAQPEALPFTPDPSRGPLSRAVATAVETGALAGPKSDVIAIPGQGQPAQQPLIIPGQQSQPAQQPIQVAEQPQSLRSRMSYDAGQRATEEQAMQAEAEARAKPKSRVAEQPQFEDRRSNLGTPFKTELAAKAAARRPDNAGFTPAKLSANEWILRREVKKQDLPPSYSRFENPEQPSGQASLDGSGQGDQPRFSNAAQTIDVDGEQLPSTNNRGKPIAPDEESTRNFWRSMKGTKVADEQGRPIEVYHGTTSDFSTFRQSEKDIGMHFGTAEQAKARAPGDWKGANIMPVYLDIKNPIRLADPKTWTAPKLRKQLLPMFKGKSDKAAINALKTPQDVRDFLLSKGYDGAVYKNNWEMDKPSPEVAARYEASLALQPGGVLPPRGTPEREEVDAAREQYFAARSQNSYIAFKPGQIKSSTGNRGTFDTSNPDIRFATKAKKEAKKKGWNDRPVQPDAVSLTGVHYTNTAGLKALDGRYYGTNHKGGESRRLSGLKGEKGKLLRNRIGFYPEGTDLAKTGESMVGRADVHRVQLDNLYDIDADPRDLKAKVDKPGMSDDDFYNALDMAIIKEGFDGIYVPKSRMIYLLGTKPVPVGARASQKPEIKERGTEASRPRNALRADVIRRLADPITKSWSVKVNVVDTPDQFPDAVKAAPGFSPELSEAVIFGDEIYIAASQVETTRDLYRLLAHEGVAHAGVEKMAGKQWPQLVKEINALLDRGGWLAKEVSSRYPKADADTRAAEAIALMAERGVRSGVMSRLIAAARKFARDLGFNVQFTDRDLRDMIAAAARQMNSGKPRSEIRMSNQDQTETGAFKRWFKDSKVVDENGKPLVVYHGASAKLDVFDRGRAGENTGARNAAAGFFFTNDSEQADSYVGVHGQRIDAYVSLQNPYRLRGGEFDNDASGALNNAIAEYSERKLSEFTDDDAREFVEYLQRRGYDGIEVEIDDGADVPLYNWVAFRPEQIKSAIGNNGQFDPANPDIRFSNQVEPGYEVEELDFLDFADVAGLSGGEQTSAALVAKAQEAWREMGTDSPFFRDWFGKSKFKKADGTPVPMYHATSTDFEAFDPNRAGESTGYAASGLGIFMTPKRSAAERYGDKVLKLYARIEKPYIMTSEESGSFDSVAETRKRREQLAAAGYDGIFIKEDGTTIAFQPQQVKAADNRGTFDLDDVRMRFSNRVGPIVNIGLDVNDGSKLTKDEAIAALQSTGARVLHHRLKQSNTEQTLIAKLDRGLTPEEAFKVSADLRQDAIAQLAGRKTGLFGPEAAKWGSFNKDYFLRFSRKAPRSSAVFAEDPAKARKTLKLNVEGRNGTREIGEALNAHVEKKFGAIAPDDRSQESLKKISAAMADEVAYQLGTSADTGTGVGWYSTNFPNAVTKLARVYPELASDQGARGMFTSILAVTSNGEKVKRNLAMTRQLYEVWRGGGTMSASLPGTKRAESLANNIALIERLEAEHGYDGMHRILLEEMTVKEINAELRARGEAPSSQYTADMTLPRAALFFGPKLGAFYANLMGSSGYLTMDLWWSRSFNRYRANLLPQPTESGMECLRTLLKLPGASQEKLIEAAEPYWKSYSDRGYKDGTEIEKAANTFMKAAAFELNEAPENATDRRFMHEAAVDAQRKLRRTGADMSIADIQAALWYYEKRLYAGLGSRVTDDIGYEEAINQEASEGDRSVGSFARGGRAVGRGAESQAAGQEAGGDVRAEEAEGLTRFSNKPVFYSALLRSIESGTMPKKAGPAAYKQWLDGALRRGEFKQSERDWLGVDAWLDGKKEVTKQDLIDFVRANQVEVQETVLRDPLLPQITEGRSEAGATKFAQYTLPGGQNYRELLLTLPVPEVDGFEQYLKAYRERFPGSRLRDEEVRVHHRRGQAIPPPGSMVSVSTAPPAAFHSAHFDQPNILAHVRFNERIDADGKRVLFVEEVQSDWHQDGRKRGYKPQQKSATPEQSKVLRALWAKMHADHPRLFAEEYPGDGDAVISIGSREVKAALTAAGLPMVDRREVGQISPVPDAPLKKEWPLTAMKRMIRYAADNGFDRISWTTGDQQAGRYDLSKQVDSIAWKPHSKTGQKRVVLTLPGNRAIVSYVDDNGIVKDSGVGDAHAGEQFTGKRLDEVVGKDVADKIMAAEKGDLSGDGLKVGGEGMRAFYDKMLPNELGKYVKKWGGKVGEAHIVTVKGSSGVTGVPGITPMRAFNAPDRTASVHAIDITPAMREAALQGQPLFSNKPTLRERAEDLLYTTKTFNAWHNTVGTQYHKAQVDADFRAVYEKGQDFLSDVSRIAMESADHAPSLLPKLEHLRDVFKRSPSAKDLEAVSDAVFTGTLEDETVYTDDELRDRFNLSDKQIGYYREFRAAIDASLDELNASEIVRITRDLIPQAAGQIRSNPADAARIAIDALGNVGTPAALDQINVVFERQVKIDELKMKGYAPLMRFGRYTVYVTDGAEQIYFGTFENEADATRVKREMQETYPQATVRQGVMSQEAWKQFKGISPDTLELFAEGAGLSYGEAFQEYLRLAKNNRSAMKRLIRRKGVAGFEQDASRVLASFITSNARAASTNYHFADMQRAAAAIDKEKGDVKDEAVKLAEYIQNPQEEAGALRGFLFTQFIGGSLASAVTNMTQPVMMTFPWLSQFAGTGAAAKHLASAGAVAAGQTPNDPDLRSALERATKDGVVAPHEIHQLYAESMRNFGSNPMIRKGLKVWGSFFSLAESFNRRISFVAAYNAAKEMGDEAVAMAGFRDAYDFAVNAVEATQGVYNRGNRPNWARGAIGATVFTFKQYSISYLEFLKRLPVKERALALGILVLASGLQGLPGAEDLEDLIDTIGQSLGYNTNSKKALREAVVNALGEDWGNFVAHGSSSFTPIDVQARMGLGNLIPGTSALKRSTTDRGRDALEAIGPAGGLIKQVMDSFSRVQAGDLSGAAASLAPLAVQNAVKGVTMATTGQYNDTQGRKVVDTTISDAVAKSIGFQPASVADVQRVIGQEQQDINMVRNVEADIADAWAQALASGDPAGVRTAVARVRDWNSKNPTTPISIDRRQLIARVRAIKSTKAERTLKATPGQLKGGVAQALGQ